MNAPVSTTTKPLSMNDLKEIAFDIRARVRRTAEDIIAVGADLARVKAQIGHGKFLDWIDREFDMSERSARNYMSVAAWAEGKSATVADLAPSTLYLLAAPSTPEDIEKEIIADIESGKPCDTKEVKARIEKAKAEPNHVDQAEVEDARDIGVAAEPEIIPPPKCIPMKPRKPTKAQLEKRKRNLERSIEDLLTNTTETIDNGFFRPTGDHLHPDDYYPAVDTYLDAATADRLVAELTETRATIDHWIDQLKAVKLATKEIVSEAEASAAVDDAPLAIPAVFRREKTA